MGDHRAGSTGPTATAVTASPTPAARSAGGKRVARHAAEPVTSAPYAGRRVARSAAVPATTPSPAEALPYAGRRVAGRNPIDPITVPAPEHPSLEPDPVEDVSGHLLMPPAPPTRYVGRRIARPAPLIVGEITLEPVTLESVAAAPVTPPLVELQPITIASEPVIVKPVSVKPVIVKPVIVKPLTAEPVTVEPAIAEPAIAEPLTAEPVTAEAATVEAPAIEPEREPEPRPQRPSRTSGRRVASRRPRVPSLPLLAGVAVLAVSAGGALQAMQPGLAGAGADDHLSPASALSGSSAVGSANLLGGRGAVVSRNSDRQALSSASGDLRAAADAQAEQRDAVLSALRGQAEKRAAQIKLHQWVLPVAPGVYHLTARFGDYSSLWSHFHTGLDFAAPTGTPIMAVAGGTITDVGYSGAYGNRTIERLPDGTELWYCHQNEFGTAVGATVKPGQVIGYIGSTGNVTGPHLHLEVHPGGGDPVDPYTALIVHGLQP